MANASHQCTNRAKGGKIALTSKLNDLSSLGRDRTILIDLENVIEAKRRTEEGADAKLEAIKPKLLALLLDTTVQGLRNLDTVQVEKLP